MPLVSTVKKADDAATSQTSCRLQDERPHCMLSPPRTIWSRVSNDSLRIGNMMKKFFAAVNDVGCLSCMWDHALWIAATLHVQFPPSSLFDCIHVIHACNPWDTDLMLELDSTTGKSSPIELFGRDSFFTDVISVILECNITTGYHRQRLRCLQAV